MEQGLTGQCRLIGLNRAKLRKDKTCKMKFSFVGNKKDFLFLDLHSLDYLIVRILDSFLQDFNGVPEELNARLECFKLFVA